MLTAEELVKRERKQYEAEARRQREANEGLLGFIDEDLVGSGFRMPAFDDPLDAARYLTIVVEIRRAAQDTKHRGRLIRHVTWFVMAWIGAVVAMVALSAVRAWGFQLDNGVLIAMLSTTTANVLGLAIIVLKGLFGNDPPDHQLPQPPKPHPTDVDNTASG